MTTGATGAPGEQIKTIAIGLKLVDALRKNGFIVYHTDAFAESNPEVTNTDWDLFLSLHCDANYAGNEGGGFFDWIDPSADISAESNTESKRIMDEMISVYFTETGIRNVESRRNPNTKFYYMWAALSEKTHCVIVEMGESVDPHDQVLLNNTDLIANALLKGIMKAFGVIASNTTTPPPVVVVPPVVDCKQQVEVVQKLFDAYKEEYKYNGDNIANAVNKGHIEGKLEAKEEIINLINAY